MSSSRTEILSAVRAALADGGPRTDGEAPTPAAPLESRAAPSAAAAQSLIDLFRERLAGVSVGVTTVTPDGVAAAVREICASHDTARIAIPGDFPDQWRPDGVELVVEDELPATDLEGLGGALTGAAIAIAESATIVFDGGTAQGRRMLTLVPDFCICVVRAEQIVGTLPEGIARISGSVASQHRPLVFMSGPSATSDIEMQRVQGVHGPRLIEAVIVDAPKQ
jgi:L-lactate dehydrogenase complex protein LldG